MVACDFGGVGTGKRLQSTENGPWLSQKMQLFLIGAVACATILAAAVTTSSAERINDVDLQQVHAKTQKLADAATFDQLSGDLLGGLERSMDKSVDSKVRSYVTGQSLAAIPGPLGFNRLQPYDAQPFVTQTQLEQLVAERRELQRKRESILRALRMRREAAAAKAAKDAAELDQERLERAVTQAKKRQLEQAQREARAAAARMRDAAVARKLAMHAAAVAASREKELEQMSLESTQEAMHVAKAEDVQDAADDVQYQQDKSVVDAKLKKYLARERDLLHKIAATEKVAAHGGQWPSEGLPVTKEDDESSPPASAQSLRQEKAASQQLRQLAQKEQGRRSSGVEGEVVDSLVRTIKQNKATLARDEARAASIASRKAALAKQMGGLEAVDRRLTKELVKAELHRH